MKTRILLFIPVYNCAKQIPRVFEKINNNVQKYIDEILVIDNQSKDDTLLNAQNEAKKLNTKISILRNKQNYNLGGSIKRAFLYALEHQFDYMITLHGDDQADIRDFLPILENQSYLDHDILIGARFHPESKLVGYSPIRTLGNRALNFVCAFINKRPVYDLIAGLNCFKLSFFKDKFFLSFPDNLTFDVHVLLYAFHHNANVKYLPITWREEDQISNAKVIKQTWIILKLFIRYLIHRGQVFDINKTVLTYESEII